MMAITVLHDGVAIFQCNWTGIAMDLEGHCPWTAEDASGKWRFFHGRVVQHDSQSWLQAMTSKNQAQIDKYNTSLNGGWYNSRSVWRRLISFWVNGACHVFHMNENYPYFCARSVMDTIEQITASLMKILTLTTIIEIYLTMWQLLQSFTIMVVATGDQYFCIYFRHIEYVDCVQYCLNNTSKKHSFFLRSIIVWMG